MSTSAFDVIGDGHVAEDRELAHPLQGEDECDEAARDRRRACAAVGLDHVAVDPDRSFAKLLQFRDRSQRPADQALDLLRASADLSGARLTLRPRGGGAREHAVFRRHPAFAGVAQE
jgi:hypothetical protein